MDLPQAIKLNAEHAIVEDEAGNHNLAKALRLGSEALKRTLLIRQDHLSRYSEPLPGETKE